MHVYRPCTLTPAASIIYSLRFPLESFLDRRWSYAPFVFFLRCIYALLFMARGSSCRPCHNISPYFIRGIRPLCASCRGKSGTVQQEAKVQTTTVRERHAPNMLVLDHVYMNVWLYVPCEISLCTCWWALCAAHQLLDYTGRQHVAPTIAWYIVREAKPLQQNHAWLRSLRNSLFWSNTRSNL
jgi:hypothetical protein